MRLNLVVRVTSLALAVAGLALIGCSSTPETPPEQTSSDAEKLGFGPNGLVRPPAYNACHLPPLQVQSNCASHLNGYEVRVFRTTTSCPNLYIPSLQATWFPESWTPGNARLDSVPYVSTARVCSYPFSEMYRGFLEQVDVNVARGVLYNDLCTAFTAAEGSFSALSYILPADDASTPTSNGLIMSVGPNGRPHWVPDYEPIHIVQCGDHPDGVHGCDSCVGNSGN
jgi:hypothetical protein